MDKIKVMLVFSEWLGRNGIYNMKAFKALGHEVKLFYYFQSDNFSFSGRMKNRTRKTPIIGKRYYKYELLRSNKKLIESVGIFQPDLILMFFSQEIFISTIEKIKKDTEAKVIFWLADEPEGIPNFLKAAKLFDFIFIVNPDWSISLKEAGAKNISYLPFACDTDVYHSLELSSKELEIYGHDVTLLGNRHPKREEMLLSLSDYDLGIWGWKKYDVLNRIGKYLVKSKSPNGSALFYYGLLSKYPPELKNHIRGGFVTSEIANKIYNASKIVLNIQHPRVETAVNSQAFEIGGSSALQFISCKGNLLDNFEDGKEIIIFKNKDELKKLVDYYLKNEEEGREIALRGMEKVLKEHTYIHRAKKILKEVFS